MNERGHIVLHCATNANCNVICTKYHILTTKLNGRCHEVNIIYPKCTRVTSLLSIIIINMKIIHKVHKNTHKNKINVKKENQEKKLSLHRAEQ